MKENEKKVQFLIDLYYKLIKYIKKKIKQMEKENILTKQIPIMYLYIL